jgi:hypothetical protein
MAAGKECEEAADTARPTADSATTAVMTPHLTFGLLTWMIALVAKTTLASPRSLEGPT